jgi:GDP/UDP-N,N'-diacetylbacillosamine 2-epimerase (hydrolysing)
LLSCNIIDFIILSIGSINDLIFESSKSTFKYKFKYKSSEIYLNKVKQLGENPKYIFNVGSTGVDNIINNNYISKTEIENLLDFKLCEKNFLITIHPLSSLSKEENIRNTINILKVLDKFKNTGLIFTYPNADFQNNFIINLVKNFIKGKKNCKLSITLGRELYLSCIKICDLVIGNSSSGIIEVPYFKKPTVNIGDRQLGRLRHKSIIDTNFDQRNILLSIKFLLILSLKTILTCLKLSFLI